MDDLVEWLRAQLDEDERVALKPEAREWVHETTPDPSGADHVLHVGDRIVSVGFFEDDPLRPADAEHIARFDPARVLREVEAKRRIIAEHLKAEYRDECRRCFDPDTAPGDYDFETFPCPTLRALALPYAYRPGYQESWRP